MRQAIGLFKYFLAAYPGRSAVMLLLLTMAALAEGVGIAAFLPLIGQLVDGGVAGPLPVEWAFALLGPALSLEGLVVLIVGAVALKSLLMLAAMTQVGYSAARAATDLRLAVVDALVRARWAHFVGRPAGNLANAVTGEPTHAADAYIAFCKVLSGGILLLVYLGLSAAISWEILAAALVVAASGQLLSSRLVAVSRRAGQNRAKFQKSFIARLLRMLDCIKPLKAMNLAGSFKSAIEGDIRRLNRALQAIIVSREALVEANEIIRAFAVMGGLYVLVTLGGQPIESLLVLALLFVRTLQRVGHMQSYYQIVAASLPAFASVRSELAAAEGAREPGASGEAPRLISAISLREVCFSYGRGNVLDGVSMTLPAGSFVAVVGPSGAGKTTIADLIIGLLRPQRGEVWIDDLPMRDIDATAWRGMIGYVPQDTFLFHDTVFANVALGEPGISRAEVETALRRAEAWGFVAALPEGMDSAVGERGTRFSHGQRQRIAIARALVRDPALLVLDEATAALDPETEAGIVATVRQLAGKITVLSTSHQPAMQRAADFVYRLEDGAATLLAADEPIAMRRTVNAGSQACRGLGIRDAK